MSGRGIAAPCPEDDGRVIAGPGQVSREWQGCVMTRPRADATPFEPANPFAGKLVGPGAPFSSGLVGTVEIYHEMMLGRLFHKRLVEVDDFFRFVIEKVDFDAQDPGLLTQVEEFFTSFGGMQGAAVLPKPNSDVPSARIVDQ